MAVVTGRGQRALQADGDDLRAGSDDRVVQDLWRRIARGAQQETAAERDRADLPGVGGVGGIKECSHVSGARPPEGTDAPQGPCRGPFVALGAANEVSVGVVSS